MCTGRRAAPPHHHLLPFKLLGRMAKVTDDGWPALLASSFAPQSMHTVDSVVGCRELRRLPRRIEPATSKPNGVSGTEEFTELTWVKGRGVPRPSESNPGKGDVGCNDIGKHVSDGPYRSSGNTGKPEAANIDGNFGNPRLEGPCKCHRLPIRISHILPQGEKAHSLLHARGFRLKVRSRPPEGNTRERFKGNGELEKGGLPDFGSQDYCHLVRKREATTRSMTRTNGWLRSQRTRAAWGA
jgi:hypothetical protein